MQLNQFRWITLFLLTSLTLFSACGSDHDHDHDPTPVGLVLSSAGGELALQDGTTVTYVNGNSITVPQNGELVINIQFISEDGDRYTPDVNDGYSLQFNAANSQLLNISHPVNNSEWSISLAGLTSGSTNINFELWHVGHSDFESRPFQVSVSEANPQ